MLGDAFLQPSRQLKDSVRFGILHTPNLFDHTRHRSDIIELFCRTQHRKMGSDIVLYRKNGACSLIPHALFLELGIPFTPVVLDFENGVMTAADGSFTNAEYKKIHPSGYVPALKVHDETIITEMPAVLTYIAELAPEKNVLGATPVERAKAYEWMCWLSGTLHAQGFGALWRPKRFTDSNGETIVKAITEKGHSRIVDCYDRIEQRLDGVHAVGGRFTVVDLNLHTFWRWSMRIGFDVQGMTEKYPRYTALAREVENRQSMQEALKAEKLQPAFEKGVDGILARE